MGIELGVLKLTITTVYGMQLVNQYHRNLKQVIKQLLVPRYKHSRYCFTK